MKSHSALVNGDVGERGQRVDCGCMCAEKRASCRLILLPSSRGPAASSFTLRERLTEDSGEGFTAEKV